MWQDDREGEKFSKGYRSRSHMYNICLCADIDYDLGLFYICFGIVKTNSYQKALSFILLSFYNSNRILSIPKDLLIFRSCFISIIHPCIAIICNNNCNYIFLISILSYFLTIHNDYKFMEYYRSVTVEVYEYQ